MESGFTRNFGQSLNLCERSPKRLLYDTRNLALEKLDPDFNDPLHRHHAHARIRLLNLQHPIEIVIVSKKTERTAELACFLLVEITRGDKFDFVRMCCRVPRKGSSVARPRMFAATGEGNADHCASTTTLCADSQATTRRTEICWANRRTSRPSTRPARLLDSLLIHKL